MIGRRGFRIAGTPCASSGSVRVRLPLPGENHARSASEAPRSPRITRPQRERAPPELTQGGREIHGPMPTTRPQIWRWASGGRR
jgi:hypothetical protein